MNQPENKRITTTFSMNRKEDESGVSGTGRVLVGVIFPSGKVIVEWIVNSRPSSMGFYDSFDEFKAIHVLTHPRNETSFTWD